MQFLLRDLYCTTRLRKKTFETKVFHSQKGPRAPSLFRLFAKVRVGEPLHEPVPDVWHARPEGVPAHRAPRHLGPAAAADDVPLRALVDRRPRRLEADRALELGLEVEAGAGVVGGEGGGGRRRRARLAVLLLGLQPLLDLVHELLQLSLRLCVWGGGGKTDCLFECFVGN